MTSQEQTEIQSILKSAQSGTSFAALANKIDGVLTPQQQQTFQTDLQQLQAHHAHHHGYHGSGAVSTSGGDPAQNTDIAGASVFSNVAAAFGVQSQLQGKTPSI